MSIPEEDEDYKLVFKPEFFRLPQLQNFSLLAAQNPEFFIDCVKSGYYV